MLKGEVLSLLLGLPETVIEETLELASRSYEHCYGKDIGHETAVENTTLLIASYIHRQLYAWLVCVIENRFQVSETQMLDGPRLKKESLASLCHSDDLVFMPWTTYTMGPDYGICPLGSYSTGFLD